jgi:putative ABC transport system permease protein
MLRQFFKLADKDFVKTIYLLQSWLSNYAYKTAISWWIFPLAGLIVLAVSWLSIIYQAFMAARKNPVETLRYQ